MKRRYPETFEMLSAEEKEKLAHASFKRIIAKRASKTSKKPSLTSLPKTPPNSPKSNSSDFSVAPVNLFK